MAADFFLKIDDIKGESQDAACKDQIELISWNWRMSQTGSAHSGTGGGSGKVGVRDISFIKLVDRSSPILLKNCCSGKHFAKAVLTIRKAGDKPLNYLTIELSDGLISSVAVSCGTRSERASETITLNFAAFKYTYTPQNKDGSAGIPASRKSGRARVRKSAERGLGGSRRHLENVESVDVTVCPESLEGPSQIRLHEYSESAAARDDTQQHAGPVGALGATTTVAPRSAARPRVSRGSSRMGMAFDLHDRRERDDAERDLGEHLRGQDWPHVPGLARPITPPSATA
jgi:type VI secretion system secreted protein Hcp